MKRPKLKYRKRIERIRAESYAEGRKENNINQQKIIQQLHNEMNQQFQVFQEEIKAEKSRSAQRLEQAEKDKERAIAKREAELKSDHSRELERLKDGHTEEISRKNATIDDIKRTAAREVNDAIQSEMVYNQCIDRTKMVFAKGVALIANILENNSNFLDTIAHTKHKSNEFEKLKLEFDEVNLQNQLDIQKIKQRAISAK